jgi:hypothetical protein
LLGDHVLGHREVDGCSAGVGEADQAAASVGWVRHPRQEALSFEPIERGRNAHHQPSCPRRSSDRKRQDLARRAHHAWRHQRVRRGERCVRGLETLGLQGPSRYFQVIDNDAFQLRDSHARFYGGVYLAMAVLLIVASTHLGRYRQALHAVFAFIFIGGLARLTQGQLGVMFGKDLAVSSVIELVGMPALALWLAAATRPTPAPNRTPTAQTSPA